MKPCEMVKMPHKKLMDARVREILKYAQTHLSWVKTVLTKSS
jgi:hypothetical protein